MQHVLQRTRQATRAYYAEGPDYVQMPPFETFRDAESYAATLAHELTHFTKHEKRLARDMGEYSPSAVRAIRALRLARQGTIDAALGARMFAQPFAKGECQRRLKQLLAG